MKKKYRDITVNGVKYAWMVTSYGKEKTLTVWLNKKELFHKGYRQQSVTPKDVADEIDSYHGQNHGQSVHADEEISILDKSMDKVSK